MELAIIVTTASVFLKMIRKPDEMSGFFISIGDDKYCIDILTQISAARSALDRVAVELVGGYAKHCLAGHGAAGKTEEKATNSQTRSRECNKE